MLFQTDVCLTEEDYLEFNLFHALHSESGKKQIRRSGILFAVFMVLLMALSVMIMGLTTFSVTLIALLGAYTVLYLLFFKKLVARNIRKQLDRLKAQGKLPFDAQCRLEFYSDRLVEQTATKRIEQSYRDLERICVVGNRFLYLYHSSVQAYIIPIAGRDTTQTAELVSFLSQACGTVERYP